MEAASIAHADHHHGPPAAHRSSRVEAPTLGMLLFIISEVMIFGAFFTAYFFIRVVTNDPWPAPGTKLPEAVAGINTAILLSSSLTIHWALTAIKRGNRFGLKAGMVTTFLLGLTFLTVQINEYVHIGFAPHDSAQATVFYSLTGLHGAHVFIGLCMLLMVTVRSFRGHYSRRAPPGHGGAGDLLALRRHHVGDRLHDGLRHLESAPRRGRSPARARPLGAAHEASPHPAQPAALRGRRVRLPGLVRVRGGRHRGRGAHHPGPLSPRRPRRDTMDPGAGLASPLRRRAGPDDRLPGPHRARVGSVPPAGAHPGPQRAPGARLALRVLRGWPGGAGGRGQPARGHAVRPAPDGAHGRASADRRHRRAAAGAGHDRTAHRAAAAQPGDRPPARSSPIRWSRSCCGPSTSTSGTRPSSTRPRCATTHCTRSSTPPSSSSAWRYGWRCWARCPSRQWFNNAARLVFIVAVRLTGTVLANILIFGGTVFYPIYRSGDALWHISSTADQVAAGGTHDGGGELPDHRAVLLAVPARGARERGASGSCWTTPSSTAWSWTTGGRHGRWRPGAARSCGSGCASALPRRRRLFRRGRQEVDQRRDLAGRQRRAEVRRHHARLVAGRDVRVRLDDRGADALLERRAADLLGLRRGAAGLEVLVEVRADRAGGARGRERVAAAAAADPGEDLLAGGRGRARSRPRRWPARPCPCRAWRPRRPRRPPRPVRPGRRRSPAA